MSTLRICKNISGRADAKMIPEDVFVSDIEPTLISDGAVHFLSHKSFYNQWFPEGIFPEDIFHCIEGQYLDSELNSIGLDDLKKKAKNILYPVVIKPNWGSYGGKDVYFVENTEKLVTLCKASCDFVVQEQIRQHKFFRRYNPGGPNTIRVYVYKSVKDHKPHVINMALRMGRGGSLDNETDGGLHTIIDEEGFLNNYAVDKYGEKFTEHPDTGYSFDDKIPAVDELKELALKISEQIYFTRIIGLDLCYDSLSRWRAIEVNTKGHTIRFAQYGGQPFFREFTDEVIEYCKKIIRH
ncbi:MAG TPA: sugar-transfer associated ATP-grasp domain-containing protein [Sphingobacterium sp.]|nr:sugar-transfer associated ATP-grasp domain-containing protein [Sphingobacterium sp.]